jgi:hypothetical protein
LATKRQLDRPHVLALGVAFPERQSLAAELPFGHRVAVLSQTLRFNEAAA